MFNKKNLLHVSIRLVCMCFFIGSFPFNIARSELAPGQHNLQVYSRKTGEAIPDNIIGGAHFYIECNYPSLDVS